MSDELIAALEKATGSDNALDVLCEVALFKPGTRYKTIRANEAGTKVIYTDRAGNSVTCWAEDWSRARRKASTIAALRARGGWGVRDQQCSNCRFREDRSETNWEQYAPCKRYPPTNQKSNGLQVVWPMVPRGEWCGEWQARHD